MPIYVLGAHNQRVQIPNQPLTVSISGSDGATLVISADAEQRIMRPNAHVAVLPRVTKPVSIRVVPAQGQQYFAAASEVTLAIGHGAASDLDPVQVVFDPVDVADKADLELATLVPFGTKIEVAVAAVADTALNALAAAARTSARKAIAPGTRAARGAVLLALDASASMRPSFADGSTAVAVEIVVGVADALGVTDVSALLVGDDAVPVKCANAAGLAEAVAQITPRWCAGARWSRLPASDACTIVCSDFPPLLVRQRYPVVVMSTDPRLDADCVRIPPPRSGSQAGPQLLADSAALDRITSSLVRALI